MCKLVFSKSDLPEIYFLGSDPRRYDTFQFGLLNKNKHLGHLTPDEDLALELAQSRVLLATPALRVKGVQVVADVLLDENGHDLLLLFRTVQLDRDYEWEASKKIFCLFVKKTLQTG